MPTGDAPTTCKWSTILLPTKDATYIRDFTVNHKMSQNVTKNHKTSQNVWTWFFFCCLYNLRYITILHNTPQIYRIHQQYSQSLVVKSGTINLYPRQGRDPAFRQWKIQENHNTKGKLVQKLYQENIGHVNITKPVVFQFFIHITSFAAILVKL